MHTRAYTAEFLGTFALAFGVSLAVARDFPFVPVIPALTLLAFVYTVGPISGAHLNPAVTCGLWSVKKIKGPEALRYIAVQLLAGFCAMMITWFLTGRQPSVNMDLSWLTGLGEALGGFLLVFAVSSVVYGRVKDSVSGILIGLSLLLGILTAANFSAGVVNPAVAFGLAALSPMYLFGSVVGGVAGAHTYKWLQGK